MSDDRPSAPPSSQASPIASHDPGDSLAGWRLSTRITAVVLATLAPLLVVVAFSYAALASQRRAVEIDDAVLIGQTVGAVVDGFARDIEGTTLTLAMAVGRSDAPIDQATLGPMLDALAVEYPVLRAIFVTDPAGRVVAAQRGEGIGQDVATRPYLAALRAGAETVWTPAIVGAQSREVTVAFGRTVRGPDRAVRGYLVAAYYPPQLLERLSVRPPPDADIAFYDSRGTLLHSSGRSEVPADQRDASSSPLMQVALGGQVARIDGQTSLYGSQARYGVLTPVPRIGWVVAFTRPLAPLEAELSRQLAQQAAWIALVIGAAALLLSWLTRRLLRPIGVLARAAGAIARGERPAVPEVGGDWEVRELAAGMAVMADAVAEREDALRRHSDRLAVLAEASRAFAQAGLDRQALLAAVVRVVAGPVGDGCAVSLVAEDGLQLRPVAAFDRDPDRLALAERLLLAPRPVDRGLAARVVGEGEPVLVPSVSAATLEALAADGSQEDRQRLGLRSLAVVPLRVRGRPVGTLTVWRVAAGAPHDADDLRLLQDLADRAGLALDNVDLFRQQEWAAERTRHLHEITGHLSRSLDAEEVLGAIARSAAELLGAPVGAVFLLDPSQGDFALAAAHGLPAERRAAGLRLPRATSLAGRALDAGLTLVVDDAAGTPGTALPALLTGQAAGSEMAAPIVSGTERLGVIKVFSPTVRRFGPEEADLLGALAAAAAVALTNARLYREAREAVRARDEFLSVAAHELKTPLAGLIGNAQLLARTQARGLLTEERVARSTGVIAESGRRLAGLVDDLLDVSRIRSGQLALRTRPVDLGELVAQIAEAHAVTLDDAHRIETLLPAARSTVEADPERLRQVVENLLDNAVKYSPSGGTVRIELVASADGAELRVVDQGIGLPPDALEAIFQPFGRAANAVERALPGMGLGLYICRDIVERHGGRLWVESPGEDRGTIAHVFLPRQPLDGTAPT